MPKRSRPSAPRQSKARIDAGGEATGSTRFSAKGLKSLRAKLGLSAADFGQLVGASAQSIYKWESGNAVPRASQQAVVSASAKLVSASPRWSSELHGGRRVSSDPQRTFERVS